MFEFLNAKLSIPARLTLIAACAAPPIALLLFLFVSQTLQQARFTQQELDGLAYISQVWPAIVAGDAPAAQANDRRILSESEAFGAAGEARAFGAARGPGRAVAGAALIRVVADNSNLTLDTEIGSFYAMDAATDALPRLMAAVIDSRADPHGQPLSQDRVQALEDVCLRDLRQTIAHDGTRLAAGNLPDQTRQLAASLALATKAPRGTPPSSALIAQIDRTWRLDSGDLRGMLNARMAALRLGLMASLALVALTLGAAVAIGLVTARGLSRRLNHLLQVMDRLNAGDTTVEVPYQSDSNETGQIAGTLAAFKSGMIAAQEQRRRAEAANAAVHDSEARYRMLAENSTDVILHQDIDFRILYVSPSAAQYGYRPEDLLGVSAVGFAHPDDQAVMAERRKAALAGEPAKILDSRIRDAHGEWVWIESTMTPIPNEDGKIAGFITTLRDISERKTAELALVDSEARYRMLAEHSTDVILHQDLDFTVLYVSPSIALYGYRPEEMKGLRSVDFAHPDDRGALAERRIAALDGRPLKTVQARLRTAQGEWVWMESTMASVHADGGGVIGFITTLRDVSERKAAELALRVSEARYRMLADNATDIILQYDYDFSLLYVSPSVSQLGYTPETFLDRDRLRLMHPDDKAIALERRAHAQAGRPVKPLQARMMTVSGDWIWFESTLATLHDDDGRITGFISTLRDVSERKAAEQALMDSEARYRMLADNATDIIAHYDAHFSLQYVSPSISQLGHTPEEFRARDRLRLMHPDDWPAAQERRLQAQAGRPVKPVQVRVAAASGDWVWFESTLATLRDDDSHITGFISTLRDVSERRAAEAALIDSEARYRMLADNTTDIIQRFNRDGIVEYMSPSVRLLGYGPEHFVGKPIAQATHPDDRDEVLQRRAALLSGKSVGPAESRAVTANGEVIWLESSPAPIFDDSGQVVGVVNVMRNITERKAAEAALEETNAELRRVARTSALGVFSASLAHEVNQPLAAAVINSEASLRWMDREPPDNERAVKAVRRTLDEVRRASDIVGRMRAMVTKEAATRTVFDLNEAVREVLALTEGERVRLGITLRRTLQPCLVTGDRVQFQQVIMNLVVNAIDAMREVPVKERRLIILCEALDDGSVQITVEDRGPGVPPEQSERIFEHLFTTKTGGTGLGLPISKSIVEAHGGRLWLENAEPRGSAFKVRLPQAGADA